MSIKILRIGTADALENARSIVLGHFSAPELSKEDAGTYRRRVAVAQDEINAAGCGARIAWELRDQIKAALGRNAMIQNGCYLRAARPDHEEDVITWHRESFYGAPPDCCNLWIPLMNVNEANTLRYIPDSDQIPDDKITTKKQPVQNLMNSDAHKIGLLLFERRIMSGVDLSKSAPMNVPEGCAALFPGALIHGASVNRHHKIRFSLDLRVMAR